MQTKDYYQILEVAPEASSEVIQAAYRALSRKYHPDLVGPHSSLEMMQIVNEAYAVLADPVARKAYDSKHSGRRQTSQPSSAQRRDDQAEGGVLKFMDDNPGYLRWLDEHPNGYVLNIGKDPRADDQVLHRARCGAARGTGRDWTGGMYMKLCSTRQEPLDAWSVRRVDIKPNRCRLCKP